MRGHNICFKEQYRKLSINYPFKPCLSEALQARYKYSCMLGIIILLCNNPVTLLIRAQDRRGTGLIQKYFFLISQ